MIDLHDEVPFRMAVGRDTGEIHKSIRYQVLNASILMAKKKASAKKMWVWAKKAPAKPAIPEAEKKATEAQCTALIERMKPVWIQPPHERWGYVSDVYGKWYRSYYYVMLRSQCLYALKRVFC